MANVIETARLIARMAMVELENALPISKAVYRDYSKEFGPGRTGTTVNIRRPIDFAVQNGAATTVEDLQDANTTLVIDKQKNVSFALTSADLSLKEKMLAERFARPAARQLANAIESDVAARYVDIPNWVGTPGQTINSYSDFLLGTTRLTKNGAPYDGRLSVLEPTDYAALAAANSALFVQDVAETALRGGNVGRLNGVKTFESNLVATHTVGALGGTPLINAAGQSVTYAASSSTYTQTLTMDGATASISGWAKAGDVFTIAGVFAVNPVTKATESHLKEFVVTADAASNGSGVVSLTISPPIIVSGAYQTCSAAPADNAAVTFKGTAATGYKQNMVFHKNAFALAMIPLEDPVGAAFHASESHEGFSIRIVGDYDFANDISKVRFDVLYGVKTVNPQLATRISGTA